MQIPEKYQKALGNLAVMAVLVWGCLWIVPKVILFLMPFLAGGGLAWLANPVVGFLEKKLKIKRKIGSALVILAVIAGIGFFLYLISYGLMKESLRVLNQIPQMWYKMKLEFVAVTSDWTKVMEELPEEVVQKAVEMGEILEDEVKLMVGEMSISAADALGAFARNIPPLIVAAIMCLLTAYFFMAKKREIVSYLGSKTPGIWRKKLRLLKETTLDIVTGYLKAQLKIEVWIYLIVAAGFFVLKVRQWYFLALLIAVLDILPVFGTGIILLPWSILEFLRGNYKVAFGLCLIWVISQLVRQMIQPKVLGDSMGMSEIPTLILLYVGYQLAGITGMVASVPLGMIVVNMNKAGFYENCKKSLRILWCEFRDFCAFSKEE